MKTETVEPGPKPAPPPPPQAPAAVKKEEEVPRPSIPFLPPESGTAEAEAEKKKPIPKPAPVPAFPAGPPEPGRPPYLRKRDADKHIFVKKKNTIRKNKVSACRNAGEGRRAPAAGTDASLETTTQMILFEKINLGEVSIEYAMERMKKGG